MNHPKDPDPLSMGDLNPNKIALDIAEKKAEKGGKKNQSRRNSKRKRKND